MGQQPVEIQNTQETIQAPGQILPEPEISDGVSGIQLFQHKTPNKPPAAVLPQMDNQAASNRVLDAAKEPITTVRAEPLDADSSKYRHVIDATGPEFGPLMVEVSPKDEVAEVGLTTKDIKQSKLLEACWGSPDNGEDDACSDAKNTSDKVVQASRECNGTPSEC